MKTLRNAMMSGAGALAVLTTIANPCLAEAPWRVVIDQVRPLSHARDRRLPLYVWSAMNVGDVDDAAAERIIKALDERGVGLIATWSPSAANREQSLARSLVIARVQSRLGLRVNVNATACLNSFFNGDEKTAHVDSDGKAFWDDSFGAGHKMGCPFTLDFRRPAILDRVAYFAQGYKQAGVPLDFVFADWEIDGPIEFNRAQAASRRCVRCRKHIADVDNFTEFQKSLREIRSALQNECYARPIRSRFPRALVGNYGVYPHDGLRYWYDYYEYFVDGQPHVADQRARYRRWYPEFANTGYTFAMPVVYTWYPIHGWYAFDDSDYRWFYNLLKVASNVGEHTPANVPIISFVHWHTTAPPKNADPSVKQFSEAMYQELLWHMLLRGHDTFFLWCPQNEAAKEIRLVHAVYAAAQEYGEFLEHGTPINFSVPGQPGPVISGLRRGNRVLVRRTDFGAETGPVEIRVASQTLTVHPAENRCQILTLSP